jgi:hypothetical protein
LDIGEYLSFLIEASIVKRNGILSALSSHHYKGVKIDFFWGREGYVGNEKKNAFHFFLLFKTTFLIKLDIFRTWVQFLFSLRKEFTIILKTLGYSQTNGCLLYQKKYKGRKTMGI